MYFLCQPDRFSRILLNAWIKIDEQISDANISVFADLNHFVAWKKEGKMEREIMNDIKLLVKTRIRSQLSEQESAELVGVSADQYRNWEKGKDRLPATEYCILLAKFGEVIAKQKCRNCYYYNGEPGDGEQFCDRKEEDVPENGHCQCWLRRDAYR